MSSTSRTLRSSRNSASSPGNLALQSLPSDWSSRSRSKKPKQSNISSSRRKSKVKSKKGVSNAADNIEVEDVVSVDGTRNLYAPNNISEASGYEPNEHGSHVNHDNPLSLEGDRPLVNGPHVNHDNPLNESRSPF